MARSTRTFAVALAVLLALVGACGDDDDAGSDDPPAETSSTTEGTEDEPVVDDPCDLLDIDDLSEVTGVEFDDATPGENSCTYTSTEGLSAIALNFTDLGDASPDVALEAAQASCDAGSVQELELSDADGGFGCTVAGVATVVATGEGILAVLTGATLSEGIEVSEILQDLATILENAITDG
jgi:hypothetical protein